MNDKILYLTTLLSLRIDNPGGGSDDVLHPTEIKMGGLTTRSDGNSITAQELIQKAMSLVIIIVLVLSLLFLIWGGIQWITSSGDKNKVQAARNKIIYSLVGLFVVLLSFTIVIIIGSVFGINIFGFYTCPPHLPCHS